ncbi:hypothetical protein [Terribacillus halophilus]|uniref:hypothetical protein n=1 Tax=Terribacillus halophilus TaxID=361279 RepID=UPI0039825D13
MVAIIIIVLSLILFLAGIGLLITFAILKKKAWIWVSSGMVVVAPVLLVVGIVTAFTSGDDATDVTERSETSAVEIADGTSDESNAKEAADEPTQEELDEQLKKEAVKGDFVKINGDQVDEGEKIYLEGEVSVVLSEDSIMPEYSFTTKEDDGYGVYSIIDLSSNGVPEEGDKLKIYGTYSGRDEMHGGPKITVTVVEKQ